MRPVALEIQAFRGWRQRTKLELGAPITALVAPNKAGKSSTLNAIEWCLFGEAVAGKGSSGIGERAGWEIYPRDGASRPTEVRLVLETRAGDIVVTRSAPDEGDKKSTGSFEVLAPDGLRLCGAPAESWLRQNGLPDWETYRRAHCFHQESARTRVIDTKDRSHILAALLGLGDDMRVREAVEGRSAAKLVEQVDAELADLERHVMSVLGRPKKTMVEIEARLATRGIERTQIQGRALEIRHALLGRARDLAEKLGVAPALPNAEDGSAVTHWMQEWPRAARAGAPALASLKQLRDQAAALNAAITQVTAFDDKWATAKGKLDAAIGEGGGRAARKERLDAATHLAAEAAGAVQRANRHAALLDEARTVLLAGGQSDQCPVCDSRVAGLVERIERELQALRSSELRDLARAKTEAETAAREAERLLRDLQSLEDAERDASGHREAQRRQLAVHVKSVADAGAHDVLAEARKHVEVLEQRISQLNGLEGERDRSLLQHAGDAETLKQLDDWLDAARRANSQIDFRSLPEWAVLNAAIDQAAGFAADLDALAEMARDAQADRSQQRESEVNRSFGKYYRTIVGDGAAGDVVVKTKQSGKSLGYELVDHADRQAVPVLNQASINALSLALVFAQAEDRARKGGLACVVLDDPVQSLDPDRQKGLAAALEELSKTCEVILAVTPQSPVLERLETHVSVERVFQHLEPYDSQGSRLGARRAM